MGRSKTPRPAHAIEAGRANLAKGREAKKRKREEAEKAGYTSSRERWAALLDGSLTVKDLEDNEIAKMGVRGKDGCVRAQKYIPSHLIRQFQSEAITRAQNKFRHAAPEAVQALIDIGNDPDVKASDRVRALQFVVERALGRMPETIRVEGANKWDDLLDAGLGVSLDREDIDATESG